MGEKDTPSNTSTPESDLSTWSIGKEPQDISYDDSASPAPEMSYLSFLRLSMSRAARAR
jgi:hypothetical protein